MERERRRLAAILSADVVGYSRLMEADESGTLAAFKRHREDLLDPRIKHHDGRIVGTAGDGLIAEFVRNHLRMCQYQKDADRWLDGYRKAGIAV